MMKEYEVTVTTKVRETYFVEADSKQEARDIWSDFPMAASECLWIDDIEIEETKDEE